MLTTCSKSHEEVLAINTMSTIYTVCTLSNLSISYSSWAGVNAIPIACTGLQQSNLRLSYFNKLQKFFQFSLVLLIGEIECHFKLSRAIALLQDLIVITLKPMT